VRFASGNAECLVKILPSQPARDSLLPLPVPPPAVFASLPEHIIETMATVLITTFHHVRHVPDVVDRNSAVLEDILTVSIVAAASSMLVKNPYLRAKLVEFISILFPRAGRAASAYVEEADEDNNTWTHPFMETLFRGHSLACTCLPSALVRLYVDVEHTGSHTQFYNTFSFCYRIGPIVESAWNIPVYRASIRAEAVDERSVMGFINMLRHDANHLLDETLGDLDEIQKLEVLVKSSYPGWTNLSDQEKQAKMDGLNQMQDVAKSYNQLANSNVKFLCLLSDDDEVRKVFLRSEIVARIAEILNYMLKRLCGDRCRDVKVGDPGRVAWKLRLLLSRVLQTFIHFHGDKTFAGAVSRDGRSYSADLLEWAAAIAQRRIILHLVDVERFKAIAAMAADALAEEAQEDEDLGEVPDEFPDPIMSTIMLNPVRLPTSGDVMDRDVISRVLPSDKQDSFNRQFLSEDMLEDEAELKICMQEFRATRRTRSQSKHKGGGGAGRSGS
jgi:ubiquitin conjugation factor E4 B